MKHFAKFLLLSFVVAAGIFLFQAQDFNGHRFDDNNPMIDQPTREWMSHFKMHNPQEGSGDVITDPSGYDNFNISFDQAEQQITQHPNNPLWLFFGVNNAPQNAYWTTNGGLNWSLNNPLYPGGTCCDPWSAYTGSGVLVYGSGVNGQYVYTSTNNGQTWTSPVLSVSGNDRNTLAAEETGTGPFANYVYAAITPGNFARSTDAGASWTTTYTTSNTVPGVMIAVGPNGSTNGGSVMYVSNIGSAFNVNYIFNYSSDGGLSFSVMSSLNDAGYVGTYNSMGRLVINNARTRPYPMIAYDNSNGPYRGRLYCVYASNVPPGNGNKPDIILRWSSDNGANWSPRITVNDNANPEQSDQWFPAIWCDRTTGKLYIKWYDDRVNPVSYTTGVWATYSTTGGATFAPNVRISNADFTYPCPGCGANQNCYRGDYDGITGNAVSGYAVWYDPRNCNYQTMGAYFPDYAWKVNPAADSLNSISDSTYFWMTIPEVKLYSNSVKFSATLASPPGTGTISLSFVNKTSDTPLDSLTSYPDSLRLKVKSSGNVTTGDYVINLKSNGPNGTPVHTRTVSVYCSPVIGIHNISTEVPAEFHLYQNFPNPFNPKTNIRFDIPKSGLVKLKIFDISGREIAVLVNKEMSAGKYLFDYDASGLSSGIYFYKIEAPGFTDVKKMILVK